MIKLFDILLEKEGMLGKYAFIDKDEDNARGLAKLQGVRWGAESNTPEEQSYYASIVHWLEDLDDYDLHRNLKNSMCMLKILKPNVLRKYHLVWRVEA